MQGIVKDGNGGYVKAAIVSFRRLTVNTDPEDISKEEAIYAQTDDEGNFTVENLDPEGKYMIEVRIEETKLETENKMSEIQPQRSEGQEAKQEKEPETEEEPESEEKYESEDESEYEEEYKIDFADADEPPYVEDRSKDYDDSFYDIPKDPEVSETFAGNVIKPNKELEGKLYILKSNMW
jgi:hypothetical protein